MSWKASGYVKELRDGLSVTEKFVLLTLADYHRTDDKLAWPSVATLAADCLMTARGVQQILARLIENGFIVKTKEGGGRGNVAGYQIVGVDVKKGEPQTLNGYAENKVSPHSGARKGERNPAQPAMCNKEEPVFELGERDTPARERKIFTKPSREEVRAYCELRGNSVNPDAWFDHYTSNGWMVGRAMMKDWQAAIRTWEHNGNGKQQHSASAGRAERTKQNIFDGIMRDARRRAASDGAQRKDGTGE